MLGLSAVFSASVLSSPSSPSWSQIVRYLLWMGMSYSILDSDLVPGTSRYTTHVVELTCRGSGCFKGQWRRELRNLGLSKRVLQANNMRRVILEGGSKLHVTRQEAGMRKTRHVQGITSLGQKGKWQEIRQTISVLTKVWFLQAMGGQLKVIDHGRDILRFVL